MFFNNVLEIGAGTGFFAKKFINEFHPKSYTAYEFSSLFKNIIQKKIPNFFCFNEDFRHIDDIHKFDLVIALEILEHIVWDIEFLEKIARGTCVIISLPSRMGEFHVRSFVLPESIEHRYKNIIKFEDIEPIYNNKNIVKYWVCFGKKI